jgi:hypothetical protein|tara:strand:- start:1359 stop:1514 length:156 start_codon:yes stop_codon:yes gene_type:complete
MKNPHIEERLDQMLTFIFEQQDRLHWLRWAANNIDFDAYVYIIYDEYAKEK